MKTLRIHVFKNSLQPVTELLTAENLKWSSVQARAGVITASSTVLEVALNAGALVSIAAVLIAFIKAKHGRRVMITTKDKRVIQVEGLTAKELEKVLEKAAWAAAIDPKSND